MVDVNSFDWPAHFSDLKKMFGKEGQPELPGLPDLGDLLPDIDATTIAGRHRHPGRIERPELVNINGTDYCRETFAPFDQPIRLYAYNAANHTCDGDFSKSIVLTVEEYNQLRKHA